MSLKLLSQKDVRQSITMHEAIDALEQAFIELARQQAQLPLRTHIDIKAEDAVTLTMPAYLSQSRVLGLKVVSVFPKNVAQQKPSINGVILLLDAATGEPKAFMDATYLTALRTGAVSGLATRYFAKHTASRLAILGSGTQAQTQVEAVTAVRPIQHIAIWSRNAENAKKFAKHFESQYDVQVYASASQAVKDADIICTATSSTEPLIYLRDLSPSVHINAVGSHNKMMQEIGTDILSKGIVIADQLEAVLAESGEIMRAVEQKQLAPSSILEIGSWLTHKNQDYTEQLTLFKSVGLAIQDLSVANVVYQNALKNHLGVNYAIHDV